MFKKDLEEIVHTRLVENYDKYYRLAFSYVHNEDDAQDIVQEGAYKAIFRSESIKKEEYIDTWIYRIMINEALQFLRRRKRETAAEIDGNLSTLDTYENLDLKKAIEELEPLDRTIIILRYFEDMQIGKIADIMELNVNTVKSRLYRSMEKMKLSLAE